MEEEEAMEVPRLDELDGLAAELSEEYRVHVIIERHHPPYGEKETQFKVMLDGGNKLGNDVKERVERFFGIKLKAKKEVLSEGMIELSYDMAGKFLVRLDKAMTCEKVGTEMKEVEHYIEIEPARE